MSKTGTAGPRQVQRLTSSSKWVGETDYAGPRPGTKPADQQTVEQAAEQHMAPGLHHHMVSICPISVQRQRRVQPFHLSLTNRCPMIGPLGKKSIRFVQGGLYHTTCMYHLERIKLKYQVIWYTLERGTGQSENWTDTSLSALTRKQMLRGVICCSC